MSDLLSTLAQQTLGLAAVVQPRVTSRFGPPPLVLADAQLAPPAPSEPSPWGPPPPGLLSGVDAQAPLFSWRQMQDAVVSEDAVAPVLDSAGIDVVEPLAEPATTLPASPVTPAPQPSAGDVTTQRLVEVPSAVPSPADQRTIEGTTHVPLAHAAALDTAPGFSTPSSQAPETAANLGTIAERAGASRDAAQPPIAGHSGSVGGKQEVPALVAPHQRATTASPPAVSLQTAAGTAGSPTDARQPAVALATGYPMDGTSSMVPAGLVQAPPSISGTMASVEPAASFAAAVQRKAEASSLAPVGHSPELAGTPDTTATTDPTKVAATAALHPVETAATGPNAPGYTHEVTLATPVDHKPALAVPQVAAATGAWTPDTPVPATAPTADSTTFTVQPGPAPAVDPAGSAPYMPDAMPVDEAHDSTAVDQPASSRAMAQNTRVTTERDTTVADRSASTTAAGPWPAQTAALTPLTPAPATPDTATTTGVVDPPGPMSSADPHAGAAPMDAVVPAAPPPPSAAPVSTSGPKVAVPAPRVSPRISTTAALAPSMPSPAPAAVAGATGPVSPVAPESNMIERPAQSAATPSTAPDMPIAADPAASTRSEYTAEITAGTSVAPAGAPVTASDRAVNAVQRALEPSGTTPGVPAQVPATASARPVTAQHVTATAASIQRAAEPAAAAPAAPAAAPVTRSGASAPPGPAAPMPDTARPRAPIPSLAAAALSHAPAVTTGRAPVTSQAAPSSTAMHLAEAPATSHIEPSRGSDRMFAQTMPEPAAAQRAAETPAVVQETGFDAPAAGPHAANRIDQTAVLPAASLRTVETPALAPDTLIAMPAGMPVAGSSAPVPAAAWQRNETAGLVPLTPTQAAAPGDGTVPMPTAAPGIEWVATQPDPMPAAVARVVETATATPPTLAPTPAAAAGFTGTVNPAAPEPNVIQPLAETAALAAGAAGWPVTSSPAVLAPGEHPAAQSAAAPGASARAPATLSAHPVMAQQVAPTVAAIQRTVELADAAPSVLAAAPATPLSAAAPTGPGARLPRVAQPPAPVLPMAPAAPAHSPVATAGRTPVTGPAAPSGTATHLTEGSATSRAEPLPGSDHTAVVPVASPRVVETPATTSEIPMAVPAGTASAGSWAPLPAAALQRGETPGLAPVLPTPAAAPGDGAAPPPAASQGTSLTGDAHAPAPRAARGDTAAADPVAPRLAGGPRVGETPVAAPVADTQAPLVVSGSSVAPGLAASRPAAAKPNADTPVVHSQPLVAPSGIARAAAQPDPTRTAAARVTETAVIALAELPQAPAATIDGAETPGSASPGPIDNPRVTGKAVPAPTVPTAAPRVTVDTSPVASFTAKFPGSAPAPTPTVAPAPGETVGPATIQPMLRGRMGDSESIVPAAADLTPTTMPGSVTAYDRATPMPTNVMGEAATAFTAAAPSPVPGDIVVHHQSMSMPATAAHTAETAVAPAPSRHAPTAVPQNTADTHPTAPKPAADHQPGNPPAPSPTVLSQLPPAASEPAATDRASSPTLTPTSHPTDAPAIIPGAPPYSLPPTPYSLLPTSHPLLPTPYSLLRITIGRIDVRVTAPPPAASARREPTRPTVSLDDYLSGVGSPP